MKKRGCLLLLLLAVHCSSISVKNGYGSCEKISVGPGTEDFVLLNTGGGATIYVSSHERRGWKVPGEIYAFDVKSRRVQKLTRTGEPADLFFAPHGVDVYRNGQDVFLYVVNHGREMNDADQGIAIYRIRQNSLEFITRIRHELINSPNDVAVAENGGFYVTNDHGSRGSFWEVLWGLKRSKLTYCTLSGITADAKPACLVAAEGLAMANGTLVRGDKVYVSATREDAVYQFTRAADGSLGDKTKLADIPGPDNLFWHEQALLTAAHTSNWKFFRHAKSADNPAPSYIVQINPGQKTSAGLYFNDGKEISAASGAFVHGGKLYISQVFEDFILECKPQP